MRAEPVTDPVAFHAEGPVWSPSWGGLRWVDLLAGDVLSLDAGGAVARRHVGDVAAALRPRRGGGAIIAVERGFVLEAPDGTLEPLGELWRDAGVRMNDGGCGPDGAFYCGSMAYDQRPGAGALHRLDPNGSTRVVLDGVTISNGLDWNPDGTEAYYADTPTRTVAVLDAELGRRRGSIAVDGFPDGLTVDAEGGIWVAVYDRGCVRRYSRSGEVHAEVELPVPHVTACTFGGERLNRLFVTTTREGLAEGEHPLAGAVFAVDPGVRGLPVRPFAG